MKKRVFSLFLVLTLILTALAGCGKDNGESSKSSDKEDGKDGEKTEQLLERGYYEVTDEDGELVGYLEVKKSEIIVYDGRAREEKTLEYEYNEDKERYELDDGELFGGERFTVEEASKKKLTLITKDKDEYTLEKLDELPGGGKKDPDSGLVQDNAAETPSSDYVELPTGCYAMYYEGSLESYLEVSRRTMTLYGSDGYEQEEFGYSYERDGSCALDYRGLNVMFTYERGDYYMSTEGEDESYRLEPIDEIPEYDGGDTSISTNTNASYIGGNGSIDLYAWLPDALYDDMDIDRDDGSLIAMAEHYDSDIGAQLIFYSILASGDTLQSAIDEARSSYGGTSSDADLLYDFLREGYLIGDLDSGYLGGVYLGDDLDYDIVEDEMEVNGRTWRYCDVYLSEGDEEAYMSLMFWMKGDDMAIVLIGGIAEDSGDSFDMYSTLYEIIYSLELDV